MHVLPTPAGLLLSLAMSIAGCSRGERIAPPTPEEVARENARSAAEALDNLKVLEGLDNPTRLQWDDVVATSASGDSGTARAAREVYAKSGVEGVQHLLSLLSNATPDQTETILALGMLDDMLPTVEDGGARFAAVESLLDLRDKATTPEAVDRCTASLRQALELAITMSPENPELLMYRGDELLSQKQYEPAIAVLTKAIRLRPALKNAFYFRGLAHHGMGDDSQAILDYSSVLELDATYADVMVARAVSHLALREPEKAVEDLTAALARKPDWAYVYEYRAKVYEALGDEKKAQADRDAATSLQNRR